MVVADAAVATYVDALRGLLGDDVAVHVVPPGEPTADSVDDVAEVLRRNPRAIAVGVGGGSALDTVKVAAAVSAARASVEHYALCANPFAARRTVVAVPTTSGTGSEVTRTCIFTDRRGRKVWTWGDELLPDLVVLDPAAAATMPAGVTATTGLDAVVHALEAATGRRQNSMVVGYAAEALRRARWALPRAVADGTDLEARGAMQEAALLAGMAIDGGGTGIAHCVGHALGSLAHVPHGLAVAVALAATLDWNRSGAPDAYAALAAADDTAADGFAGLAAAVGLPAAVRRFGGLALTVDDLAEAMNATENQPMLHNNARPAGDHRPLLAERTLSTWADWVR